MKFYKELQYWLAIFFDHRKSFLHSIFFVLAASVAEVLVIFSVSLMLSQLTENQLVNLSIGLDELAIYTILIVCIGGGLRIISLRHYTNFSFLLGGLISTKILENYINSDYKDIVKRSKSDIMTLVTKKSDAFVHGIILPFMQVVSGIALLISVALGLLIYSFQSTVLVLVTIFIGYVAIFILSNKARLIFSKDLDNFLSQVVIRVKDITDGVKQIKLSNSEHSYVERFKKIEHNLKGTEAKIITSAQVPRFVVEMVVYTAIAILLIVNESNSQSSKFLPYLILYSVAALKILPVAQLFYSSISVIKSNASVYRSIKQNFISSGVTDSVMLESKTNNLLINDVIYEHDRHNKIGPISAIVPLGSLLRISGASGTGKSTLVDLIVNLLHPKLGSISYPQSLLQVDGRLTNKIIYISQLINKSDLSVRDYLIGDANSLKKNISDKILLGALSKACLGNIDENFLNKSLNDDKSELSSGQLQRVVLSRLFLEEFDIAVMDEAINAIQPALRRKILHNIKKIINKNQIVILISHDSEANEFSDITIEMP